MPTAAKLVAGILWALLAWFVSNLIKPYFPEGSDLGLFAEVNAALGLLLGWTMAGPRAGQGGWSGAISFGFTTTVALVVTGVFMHSFAEMVRLSLRRLYEGPVEGLVAVFGLMAEYFTLMAKTDVMVTLLVGGIVAGLVTEWAGRRWR
jgi:hypothetical protein